MTTIACMYYINLLNVSVIFILYSLDDFFVVVCLFEQKHDKRESCFVEALLTAFMQCMCLLACIFILSEYSFSFSYSLFSRVFNALHHHRPTLFRFNFDKFLYPCIFCCLELFLLLLLLPHPFDLSAT